MPRRDNKYEEQQEKTTKQNKHNTDNRSDSDDYWLWGIFPPL